MQHQPWDQLPLPELGAGDGSCSQATWLAVPTGLQALWTPNRVSQGEKALVFLPILSFTSAGLKYGALQKGSLSPTNPSSFQRDTQVITCHCHHVLGRSWWAFPSLNHHGQPLLTAGRASFSLTLSLCSGKLVTHSTSGFTLSTYGVSCNPSITQPLLAPTQVRSLTHPSVSETLSHMQSG